MDSVETETTDVGGKEADGGSPPKRANSSRMVQGIRMATAEKAAISRRLPERAGEGSSVGCCFCGLSGPVSMGHPFCKRQLCCENSQRQRDSMQACGALQFIE
ncbi:MAG: hypothetical protein AB7V55_04060 [Oscillospiraceae bacterium]